MQVPTIRVKATDPAQGDFVVINESDFDADRHELFDAPKDDVQTGTPQKLGIVALRDELTARGITFDANAKKAELQALLDQNPAQ